MTCRTRSAALVVDNTVRVVAANADLDINPDLPSCVGQPGCTVTLNGELHCLTPPLTSGHSLIRTYRIVAPSSYARTVLLLKLRASGTKVEAPTVEQIPLNFCPQRAATIQPLA